MKPIALTHSITLALLVLLAGCSSRSSQPDFTASGYLADRGVVRIWRKDSPPQVSHMIAIYTPFSGVATETTDYLWQDGKLASLERHVTGDRPDDVTLRFDSAGSLSFMQRQLSGRREAVSADAVALYQFDAQRMLRISDDLITGRVQLIQGRWSPTGSVTSCEGNVLTPAFDGGERRRISGQQADGVLSVAWLEAAGDTQLLLVSREDLCQTQPKESEM